MYSDKLKNSRVRYDDLVVNGGKSPNYDRKITISEIREMLKDFCTADDLVGVPPAKAYEVFLEYLKENNIGSVSLTAFSRAVRAEFGLKNKRVRVGDKLPWVYAKCGAGTR